MSNKEYKILHLSNDPDDAALSGLEEQYHIRSVASVSEGLKMIDEDSLDLVIEDVDIDIVKEIKTKDPSVDVLHIFEEKNAAKILEAAEAGISGYLVKPFDNEELFAALEILKRYKHSRDRYETMVSGEFNNTFANFIGQEQSFTHVISQATKLKGHIANVLITGESGTGKEMLARFIHNMEGDPRRPFVAINCAAIPESLMESELFGHEKGAFTGALQRKLGKFEMANGGDIFLDEISALKPELQAKILRALEEKTICRIGNVAPIKMSFRAIAATNDDLEKMIKKGSFRLDLYHRLKVVELKMPALRERINDIPCLVDHFINKHNRQPHKKIVTEEALQLLTEYSWPGNIRELENLIHNLIIMAPNGTIEADDIPLYVREETRQACPARLSGQIAIAKKARIKETLAKTNGNKSETARILGISRTTINKVLVED